MQCRTSAKNTQPVWRWRVYGDPRTLLQDRAAGKPAKLGSGSTARHRSSGLTACSVRPHLRQHQSWGGACAVEQGRASRCVQSWWRRLGRLQPLARAPASRYAAFTLHLRDIFEPAVRAHAGVVIKTTGDGICAIFQQAGDARGCARDPVPAKDRPSASAPTSS